MLRACRFRRGKELWDAWVRHAQENQCVASHRIAMFADDHLIGYIFDTNDYWETKIWVSHVLIGPKVSLCLSLPVEKARWYIHAHTSAHICTHVQLTLEQHGFELHRSSYMWMVFNKYCTVLDLWWGVRGCGRTTEPYALICAILYRVLGHRRILVSARGPGTKPPRILRDSLSFRASKVTCGLSTM